MSYIDYFWGKKKKPDNTPPVERTQTPWLRVWALLSTVNLKELWPVLLSVPAIVFFAISGFIAWVYICLRAVVLFVRRLFK
jgi:hypothetical protein